MNIEISYMFILFFCISILMFLYYALLVVYTLQEDKKKKEEKREIINEVLKYELIRDKGNYSVAKRVDENTHVIVEIDDDNYYH